MEAPGSKAELEKPIAKEDKIPLLEKVIFASGDMAFNLIWMPLAIYANPFFTDICGIPVGWVAAIFLFIRVLDLPADIVVGVIADHTTPRQKLGKFRLYMAYGAIPLGIISAAMFYSPNLATEGKAIWLFVTYLLVSLLYSATNVPYSAQMKIMSPDHRERNMLAAFRMVGAQLGVLIVSAGMLKLVSFLGGGNQKAGYFYTTSLFGLIVIVCLYLTALWAKDRTKPEAVDWPTTKKNLVEMAKCSVWWILLVTGLFTILVYTMRFGAIVYYIKYYMDPGAIASWGGKDEVASIFFTSGTICALAGSALYAPIARMFDKKWIYIVVVGLSTAASIVFAFVPRDGVGMLIAIQVAFSTLMGPTGAIMFSMYTDVADYLKVKNGNDTEGVAMAVGSFCNKLGWSIGPTISLIVMSVLGYVPDAPQSKDILNALVATLSWGPAAACIVSIVFMLLYPLNRKKMNEITTTLKARVAAAAGQ
ncbi:MAG: glycoside-pentoside-hexuronide (GPH):cation symporter [Polyangiaceae bacterium]|jgi:GPH family glycoside/pentoside/hexuronide:cation symporter